MVKRRRVLVCPLNWGLGHATRCVPLIRALSDAGFEVVVGAEGGPLAFLKEEFPWLQQIEFHGWQVRLPHNGRMVLKMVVQLPWFINGILKEHRQLKKLIREYRIDAVVSDNRYGLWSSEVPCIFITHQVRIKFPRSWSWPERVLFRLNGFFIRRYSECWIPDTAGDDNFSGDLSHNLRLPGNAFYVGPLSRFHACRDSVLAGKKYDYEVLAMISGPEPQRSIFEGLVLSQLAALPCKALVIRGLPQENETCPAIGAVEIYNHLPTASLQEKLCRSAIVLARSGYSTLMDLAAAGKPAILVPTPGQTEQEYLARRLAQDKVFYSAPQTRFDLKEALEEANHFKGLRSGHEYGILHERIGNLVRLLG